MAQLICRDISLGYDRKTILRGLSFSVSKGDYLCIVGENGSGKSTLVKTILRLLILQGGQISFGDGLSFNEIGYLPQQTDIQKDFPASVTEVVLSGCLNRSGFRPYYTREEKQIARGNMERLGIANLHSHCYRELSGGQQQRVLLARALCAARKMLLLDEPVSGLDPKAAAEMYELIAQLNADKITIIMISHDVDQATGYASHVLHIGDKIFFGPRDLYRKSNIFKTATAKGETI